MLQSESYILSVWVNHVLLTFVDRPTDLLARAQTFSSYKHHYTVKVLIGITPQGTICFVSEAWEDLR
jgi:hypothetical protein